jgi:hypothetical protein
MYVPIIVEDEHREVCVAEAVRMLSRDFRADMHPIALPLGVPSRTPNDEVLTQLAVRTRADGAAHLPEGEERSAVGHVNDAVHDVWEDLGV